MADGNLVTQKLKPSYLVCDILNEATNDGSGSKKRPVTFRCIIYIGGDRAGYGGGISSSVFRQYVKGSSLTYKWCHDDWTCGTTDTDHKVTVFLRNFEISRFRFTALGWRE